MKQIVCFQVLYIRIVMTQPKLGKTLSALSFNKACMVLFIECSYTLKRVFPIKI